MEIVNATPVPVTASVTGDIRGEPRTAIVTAKATFLVGPGGRVRVERDKPFKLLDEDEQTEWGLLPRDNLPKVDPTFEVILLGKAHAPGGDPVARMEVALSVGDTRRVIAVHGNRRWVGTGPDARPGAPEPFTEMLLDYPAAYGGREDVLIDVDSPIEVSEPVNPDGKGFNHVDQAEEMRRTFNTPDGFPRYRQGRELPNLENPDAPIAKWDDAPLPACWATPPLHSAMLVHRLLKKHAANPERQMRFGEPEVLHRAHPDWVIDLPAAGARVVLEGMSPEGRIEFALPELRMKCDIRVGGKTGSVELVPKMLVLLPEIRRFYLVYRNFFRLPYHEGEERVIRVRGERGWYGQADRG